MLMCLSVSTMSTMMKTKILIENEVIMAGHSKWNNIKRRKML